MKTYKIIREFPLHKLGDVLEEANGCWLLHRRDTWIDLYEQDVKQLLRDGWIEEVDERWKPELASVYYFVTDYGKVHGWTWDGGSTDERAWEFGNCFKTKEEAEEARDAIAELLASRREGK